MYCEHCTQVAVPEQQPVELVHGFYCPQPPFSAWSRNNPGIYTQPPGTWAQEARIGRRARTGPQGVQGGSWPSQAAAWPPGQVSAASADPVNKTFAHSVCSCPGSATPCLLAHVPLCCVHLREHPAGSHGNAEAGLRPTIWDTQVQGKLPRDKGQAMSLPTAFGFPQITVSLDGAPEGSSRRTPSSPVFNMLEGGDKRHQDVNHALDIIHKFLSPW